LLYPAFQVQRKLQKKIMGKGFWAKQSDRRIEISKGKFVPTISKVTELQMSAISSYDFERGLLSLGLSLSPDEVAALVGGLRLDVHGMINHADFCRFVSLPLISKPEDVDTLIASVIKPPPPPTTTSSTTKTPTGSFSGVTEEAASFSIKVPRPVHAQPSPLYRERFCPPSPRHIQKYERKVPPPQKMNSAWAYADAEAARKRPLVHVPWPCADLHSSQSAFWAGVNKLEQQMLREIRLRAEVKAAFSAGGEQEKGGGAPGTVDLRRAYLFFDRRGKRALQVEDLHETLADLKLVDRMPRVLSWGAELEPLQPVQPKVKKAAQGPVKGEDDPNSWDYIDVDDDGGKMKKAAEAAATEAATGGGGGGENDQQSTVIKKEEEELQKLTDSYVAQINKALEEKEKERRGSVITSNESLQECASGSSPIGSIQCRLQEEAIA
jgi:hypothetical protein